MPLIRQENMSKMTSLIRTDALTSVIIDRGVEYAKTYAENKKSKVNTAICFSNLSKIATIAFGVMALTERTPELLGITGIALVTHLYLEKKIQEPIELFKSFGVLNGGESQWGFRKSISLVNLDKALKDAEAKYKPAVKTFLS